MHTHARTHTHTHTHPNPTHKHTHTHTQQLNDLQPQSNHIPICVVKNTYTKSVGTSQCECQTSSWLRVLKGEKIVFGLRMNSISVSVYLSNQMSFIPLSLINLLAYCLHEWQLAPVLLGAISFLIVNTAVTKIRMDTHTRTQTHTRTHTHTHTPLNDMRMKY